MAPPTPARPRGWAVEHVAGSASAFHRRDLPDPVEPAVWWFEVEGPAVVLGSTQPDDLVDRGEAARRGIEVVRRRSGGGAVWLEPTQVLWVDLVVPATHPRWEPDVGRSARWVGEAWAAALAEASAGRLAADVHPGPMVASTWSSAVCFAGLAPGELVIGGRKVLGISQRRTRAGARFQCALLLGWDPTALASVLALPAPDRAALVEGCRSLAAGVGPLDASRLVAALAAALAAAG